VAGPAGVAATPLGAGACGDDGWDAELTPEELALLAAWDRVGDVADELDEHEAWLAGLLLEPGEEPAEAAVPEVLPGLTPRRGATGVGFDAGLVADTFPPGPVLAGLAADKQAEGLACASDDELAGLMIAWRRIGSWAAAGELAAVAELDRRRTDQVAAGADVHLGEHVADEVAMVLTLTSRAADSLTDFAVRLARLPKTSTALQAGDIDVPKAMVIVDELTGLDGPHVGRVEACLIGRAPGQTTGELRRAARRAVIAADPDAARVRKEKAAKEARVECWQEQAGTAALAGRDLPAAEALSADQHISAYARQLKTAGAGGTLDELRARVYLALLNGQPVESLVPAGTPGGPGSSPPVGNPAVSPEPAVRGQVNPALPAARGHVNPVLPAARGNVNLVLPLATWLGWAQSPGEVAGFGPLDAADSRALAAALASGSGTQWCVTITGADGRAVAHGCAKAGPGKPPGGCPGRGVPGEGPGPPPGVRRWLGGIGLAWLETGTCSHRRESRGYRPSRLLTHLVQVRHQTCTAPGCRRPATACDFEHTVPYHRGGRTCECNGGPVCRRHHRAKQAHGWRLEQPEPGILLWTTPSGRTYTTRPAEYPV
jgi:Domain of unknown function (DUF222)